MYTTHMKSEKKNTKRFFFICRCSMRQSIRSFSWFLYGGVTCYCMQRFLMDFIKIRQTENDLFQTGDIVILDVWNRLQLDR